MTSTDLVEALAPTVERLYERHVTASKEWFPHELVPWERGADTDPRGPFDESKSPHSPAVRAALMVNLLTEDNLPYYFETIHRVFGQDAWRMWAKRWTAEEMRHAIVIRDYIAVSHSIDLYALERARMHQVSGGLVPQPDSPHDAIAYVAMQELATRISHRNTGQLLDDEAGYKVMARVAADENLHYLFYRDLVSAALEIQPSEMMLAIERQVREFEMPGLGILDFTAMAAMIADAGIYDFVSHHDQVLAPVVLRHWDIEHVEGLSPEAELARDRLVEYIGRVGRVARRLESRRERKLAAAPV
jgi:acyl-[acyl-carrier-protein] desaturase